ncbi:hypothetical protein D3C73_625090 [compost metagenome]
MFGRHVRRAIDVNNGVLGVEHKQAGTRQAGLDAEVGGGAVDLHFLVAKDLADHVVADVQPGQLHQLATDSAIVDQHFQIAIGAAQQFSHRIAAPADITVAVEFAETGFHRFKAGEQLLELEASRRESGMALQRIGVAVQANLRIQLAAGHAETQRLEAEHAIGEYQMGIEIVERQFFAVHDALAGELDIGVHIAPAVCLELFDRQHFVRRLFAVTASGLLLGVGVGTNQRCQVSEQQLIGQQRTAELRSWLAGHVGQVAMDVTFTDLAVECFIVEYRATRLV